MMTISTQVADIPLEKMEAYLTSKGYVIDTANPDADGYNEWRIPGTLIVEILPLPGGRNTTFGKLSIETCFHRMADPKDESDLYHEIMRS